MSSEAFLVSARKYRPQTFDSVVGQSHVTQTLKNAIQNQQLAHAYLFCGPRGVGKTTCARIFAKTINCLNLLPNGDPCNKCESCTAFNNNTSLNIYELDAASNNSVEDIRALVDQVRFAPHLGKYKVYIIDEVHMLSQAAFNAFLKTLEEPPSYAKFILATTEKHKILPTILSRCQVFNFNRISTSDIVSYLEYLSKKENVEYDKEALYLIAQKADGGLRDACSIFDQQVAFGKGILRRDEVAENLHMLDEMLMFEFSEFIAKNNISGCLHILDKIVKKGFDLHLFLTSLANHFRNILISTDPLTVPLIESSEEIKNQYANRASLFSSSLLLKILQLLSRADVNFKNSRNPRLFTESILIQLCSLTQSDEKKNELNEKKEIKIPEHSAKFIHTSTTEKTFPKFSNNPISKGKLELFKKNSKSITELIEIAKSSNGIAIELNVPAKTSSEAQDALLTKFTERNFTENEILLKLEDFIHNVAERNKYLSIALKNAQKKFENGYLFLNFLNETDKISFETERTNLYDFLTVMAEKKIYGIKVDVIKASPDNESKELNDPYKRFEQILIEYPWIAELKKNLQLNLEI